MKSLPYDEDRLIIYKDKNIVSGKLSRILGLAATISILSGCQAVNLQEFFSNPVGWAKGQTQTTVATAPLQPSSSIVVCRAKQCAPAKLSMSREYIYNSLLQLFDNNNRQKALICQADPGSHVCLENYVTLPITVGITPAYMYIDSVKITDVLVGKGNNQINLILNYNLTYNGQSPDCAPSKSLLFARNVNHILLEDSGYSCKMTSVGHTTVKTVFAIDYIDLDYGFIGGFYSIGLSGPAYGGGNGYMLLRLPKDAYPLSPQLTNPKPAAQPQRGRSGNQAYTGSSTFYQSSDNESSTTSGVQIFPLERK